jgi:hypothetical protein
VRRGAGAGACQWGKQGAEARVVGGIDDSRRVTRVLEVAVDGWRFGGGHL